MHNLTNSQTQMRRTPRDEIVNQRMVDEIFRRVQETTEYRAEQVGRSGSSQFVVLRGRGADDTERNSVLGSM